MGTLSWLRPVVCLQLLEEANSISSYISWHLARVPQRTPVCEGITLTVAIVHLRHLRVVPLQPAGTTAEGNEPLIVIKELLYKIVDQGMLPGDKLLLLVFANLDVELPQLLANHIPVLLLGLRLGQLLQAVDLGVERERLL